MPAPYRELSAFSPNNQGGAKCSICGMHPQFDPETGERARVFSTGVHIHMEGPFEICSMCMRKGGEAVGMISASEAETLRADVLEWTGTAADYAEKAAQRFETVKQLGAELAIVAEETSKKVAKAYDHGYDDGRTATAVEVAEPTFEPVQ